MKPKTIFLIALFLTQWNLVFSAELISPSSHFRILALGDSYTIGQSVEFEERWPNQLAELLDKNYEEFVEVPTIIARAGWTTGELLADLDKKILIPPYNMVSLLIGTNNQYRGRPTDEYRKEFRILLEQALLMAGGNPTHVVVLSIPDWSVTPFAGDRDRDRIRQAIDRFNQINKQEANRLGTLYVDITTLSRTMAADPTLLSRDGLHPSGKMYAQWAQMTLEAMLPIYNFKKKEVKNKVPLQK